MATEQEVIRQFLVSLGFQIQEPSLKKFTSSLENVNKLAFKAGAAVIGVAVAAEAMTQVFARSMERMYYASIRNKSTVESLQAIRFGAQQVGVDADEASSALESFSQILRTQPGSRSLLEQIIGTSSEGKDNVELFYSLIKSLKTMPYELASNFAAGFGMDERTFFQFRNNIDELIAADARRRQMNKDAEIDAQRAAEASRQYMNTLRQLWERIRVLTDAMAIKMLPAFLDFTKAVDNGIVSFQKWLTSGDAMGTFSSDIDTLTTSLGKLKTMLMDENNANWVNTLAHVLKTGIVTALHSVLGLRNAVLQLASGDFKGAGQSLKKILESQLNAASLILTGDIPDNQKPDLVDPTGKGDRLSHQMIALGLLRKHYNTAELSGADMEALEREMAATEARISSMRAQGVLPTGPGRAAALGYDAAGASVGITQTTQITVVSPDASEAGKSVAREQDNVNSNLVRNAAGAIR